MPDPAEGLSFILPVCNQAPALEPALTAWTATLQSLNRPFELIVVDDGSTDATVPTLAQLTGTAEAPGRWPQLRVLRHPARRGFGAALRTAVAEARYPLLFYTGLDFDYSPGEIKKFLERIGETDPDFHKQPDLINGFRARLPVPPLLRAVGTVWRGFLRIVFGLPTEPWPGWLGWAAQRYRLRLRWLFGVRLQDVDCKFKLLRRRVFDRFPIQADGDFVHAEIIAKVNFLGSLIEEHAIAEKPGPYLAVAEPPPAPPAVRREMMHVFRHPEFRLPPGANLAPSNEPPAAVPEHLVPLAPPPAVSANEERGDPEQLPVVGNVDPRTLPLASEAAEAETDRPVPPGSPG